MRSAMGVLSDSKPCEMRRSPDRCLLSKDVVDPSNEPLHLMVEINAAIKVYSGAVDNVAHFSRKLLRGGHGRTVQQYGNDRNVSLQRRFDFHSDPILSLGE